MAVVEVMSRVEECRCQWPMNRALAVPEGPIELFGPELALGVLVTAGTPGLEVTLLVEEVSVPDVFFEHPAAATVTSPTTAIINPEANPDFTIETRVVMRSCLQSRATTPRAQWTDGIRLKR